MTSYTDILTGEEVIDYKYIAINYISGRFWLDFVSTVPFDLILTTIFNYTQEQVHNLILLSTLKMFRVLRLGKIINYMNSSDDWKFSLKLVKLCFILIIYIHISGCTLFRLSKQTIPRIHDTISFNQL